MLARPSDTRASTPPGHYLVIIIIDPVSQMDRHNVAPLLNPLVGGGLPKADIAVPYLHNPHLKCY